jgi:hypothetical protein
MNGVDNVERFMKQMAEEEAGAPAPSASAVWWRAELRRLALEERATRPMRIADGVACALCSIAAAWLAAQLGALGFVTSFCPPIVGKTRQTGV